MIYLYYVYRSTLLEQNAAAFLLMSTINCIFILLVWYNQIVMPFLESSKEMLEKEYRWEQERLFLQDKKAIQTAGSILLPDSAVVK